MPVSQPDEPSLEEITTRALQEEQSASSHTARRDMPHNPQSLPSAQQAQWSASVPHSQQSPSQEAQENGAMALASEPEPHIEHEEPVAANGVTAFESVNAQEPVASAPAEAVVEPAPMEASAPLAAPIPTAKAPFSANGEAAAATTATAAVEPDSTPAKSDKAPETAPLKVTPLLQGQKAAKQVAGFARSKAAPIIANGVLWLAHNLRRRELRKRYGEALVFTHNKVLDRRLEQLFFVPTLKGAITNPAPERGILYDGPVPTAVFNWALSALPEDLREYTFIDFHAGRGRTMLLASARNFERIVGFEYDEELFDDLLMNIAQYPRSEMECRNLDCYRGDIDGIRIPDQPSVLYFSSAWRERMFANIMEHVRQTYQQSPRRMYIILENADNAVKMPKDGIFFKIELPAAVRAKLKLLSPMDFQIYRTTV
ncbi:MAG: hypothetical protein P8Y67_05465 [Alphaproteobacteria bacterium]